MRILVRNAWVGATISCLLAAVFLLFVSHEFRGALTISPPWIHWAALQRLAAASLYMWCAATFGAIVYGVLAQKLGIYGQGSHALRKWKNALLSLLIMIPITATFPVTSQLLGLSPEIAAPLMIATGLAIVMCDGSAPSGE